MLPLVNIELSFLDGYHAECRGVLIPTGFIMDMTKPKEKYLFERIQNAMDVVKDKISPLPLFLGDTVSYACKDFTFSMHGVYKNDESDNEGPEEEISESTEELLARFSTKGQTPQ